MHRLLAVVILAIAALLAGILYELHGLNRRLDAAGLAVLGALAPAAADASAIETPEQRIERLERTVREHRRAVDDMTYVLNRSLGATTDPRKAPQSPEHPARRPSQGKP